MTTNQLTSPAIRTTTFDTRSSRMRFPLVIFLMSVTYYYCEFIAPKLRLYRQILRRKRNGNQRRPYAPAFDPNWSKSSTTKMSSSCQLEMDVFCSKTRGSFRQGCGEFYPLLNAIPFNNCPSVNIEVNDPVRSLRPVITCSSYFLSPSPFWKNPNAGNRTMIEKELQEHPVPTIIHLPTIQINEDWDRTDEEREEIMKRVDQVVGETFHYERHRYDSSTNDIVTETGKIKLEEEEGVYTPKMEGGKNDIMDTVATMGRHSASLKIYTVVPLDAEDPYFTSTSTRSTMIRANGNENKKARGNYFSAEAKAMTYGEPVETVSLQIRCCSGEDRYSYSSRSSHLHTTNHSNATRATAFFLRDDYTLRRMEPNIEIFRKASNEGNPFIMDVNMKRIHIVDEGQMEVLVLCTDKLCIDDVNSVDDVAFEDVIVDLNDMDLKFENDRIETKEERQRRDMVERAQYASTTQTGGENEKEMREKDDIANDEVLGWILHAIIVSASGMAQKACSSLGSTTSSQNKNHQFPLCAAFQDSSSTVEAEVGRRFLTQYIQLSVVSLLDDLLGGYIEPNLMQDGRPPCTRIGGGDRLRQRLEEEGESESIGYTFGGLGVVIVDKRGRFLRRLPSIDDVNEVRPATASTFKAAAGTQQKATTVEVEAEELRRRRQNYREELIRRIAAHAQKIQNAYKDSGDKQYSVRWQLAESLLQISLCTVLKNNSTLSTNSICFKGDKDTSPSNITGGGGTNSESSLLPYFRLESYDHLSEWSSWECLRQHYNRGGFVRPSCASLMKGYATKSLHEHRGSSDESTNGNDNPTFPIHPIWIIFGWAVIFSILNSYLAQLELDTSPGGEIYKRFHHMRVKRSNETGNTLREFLNSNNMTLAAAVGAAVSSNYLKPLPRRNESRDYQDVEDGCVPPFSLPKGGGGINVLDDGNENQQNISAGNSSNMHIHSKNKIRLEHNCDRKTELANKLNQRDSVLSTVFIICCHGYFGAALSVIVDITNLYLEDSAALFFIVGIHCMLGFYIYKISKITKRMKQKVDWSD